jgi:hypothetical protein
MAKSSGARDGNRRLSKRNAVEINKPLPGDFAAKGAGMRQGKFRESERSEKSRLLRRIGVSV